MSTDTIDLLHEAEDFIGVQHVALIDALHRVQTLRADPIICLAGGAVLTELERGLQRAVEERFCRSECASGQCSEECGCQAHGDGDHPGWVAQRTIMALVEEFGVDGGTALMPEDEWALIEFNASTGEHWLTVHVDADSAEKYAQSQETSWTPVALVHLQTRERLLATVERTMSIQWNEQTQDVE